jgi:flagellar protein FlbD
VIYLTRLHGEQFVLNEDCVERIEQRPDTTITTVDGHCYTVTESVGAVVDAVTASKAAVVALAKVMATTSPPLRVVE